MKDYVAIAVNYAQEAIADKHRKKFCVPIRQAAQRFLDDLERAKRDDCAFFFDEWHANDPCAFIECLPHVEGTWDSPDIVMHPSHVFFVVQLFGFRKRKSVHINGEGLFYPRRFTSALFAVARKNAKSTLASAIMLYCQSCEPESGKQLYSAATTYDQASIIWKVSKRMVEMTPDLREQFNFKTFAKSVVIFETGSAYKPIHAKASTQDGLNPSHVALDEIHAHKDADLLNVLQSAAGARANPLWLFTTTEGYTNAGPWAEIRGFVLRMLKGVFGHDADHFLAVFYKIDDEDKTEKIKADDPLDPTTWIKANPLMDVNPHLAEAIFKEAVEAKHIPSKMAEFLIKRCNRSASTGNGWIDLNAFQKCGGAIDFEWLMKHPCYGGLDLASTMDFCAFRLVWLIDGVLYTYGWRWVPKDAVKSRSERGTVNYGGWVQAGWLKATEGNVADYDVIEADIKHLNRIFNIQKIGYDRWNATSMVNNLEEDGIEMVEFIQGTKSYHPAMKFVEMAYVSNRLAHHGDPVLNWCASNFVCRYDDNMNMAPDRKKAADKIDDMCALLMATGALLATESYLSFGDL